MRGKKGVSIGRSSQRGKWSGRDGQQTARNVDQGEGHWKQKGQFQEKEGDTGRLQVKEEVDERMEATGMDQ